MRDICGVNAEMADQTFGQALGELILQKRRAVGLTQIQLSEDAYKTSSKVRRISELESGLVANPHPKTIDPIVVALKITEAEIENCAKRAARRRDEDLDRAYREARNLIDAIALQFEHNQPNASLAELDDFLRAKATEWAALRGRITAIDASETALSKLKEDATNALANGQFAEVDELLAQAEERYQNEHTLVEVRKQAELRIIRGDNSLFSGDPDAALLHYKSASEFFRPFDEKEMADTLDEIAYRNYETSRRSVSPSFFISAKLLEIRLELDIVKNNEAIFAQTSYQLSLALRNHHLSLRPNGDREALDRAIDYSHKANNFLSGSDASFRKASVSISLANCLMDRAQLATGTEVDDIAEVILLLEKTRNALREDPDAQELRANACNSLGAAFLSARRVDPNCNAAEMAHRALDAFQECVLVSETYFDAENWGAAKTNIGRLLAEMAEDDGLEDYQSDFLRIRAISEHSAAIETIPFTLHPFLAADIHESMADLLIKHAVKQTNIFAEPYLFRALQSYEAVTTVYAKQTHPARWARVRERIGSIFAQHSSFASAAPEEDVKLAIENLEMAAAVFEEIGDQSAAEISRAKIATVLSQKDG